jgi:hypothetical protein
MSIQQLYADYQNLYADFHLIQTLPPSNINGSSHLRV